MKQYLPLTLLVLLFASASANALPPEKGFYIGGGYVASALNNDGYIYSSDNNARQPALNIKQSNKSKDSASSFNAGYNFYGAGTGILGKPMLQLGVQGGYTELGEYTINIHYDPDLKGYRKIRENAQDLLLTSSLYWENGFNLFFKAGVARQHGKYTQQGLLTARQPSFVPEKETAEYTLYRPEFAVGTGVLLRNRFNLFIQYTVITGKTPDTGNTRFGVEEMVELPNTLYKADYFMAGITVFL